MGQSKRHHIVPQFILRNFTNKDGILRCFRRGASECYGTSPTNALAINHLYSGWNEDGTRDTNLESEIAKVDGSAARVVKYIIGRARAGKELTIAPEEKNAWLEFLRLQNARAVQAANSLPTDQILDRLFEIYDKNIRQLTEYERRLVKDENFRKRIKQNSWVGSLGNKLSFESESMEILKSRDIGIWVIKRRDWSFIIGDFPVVRRGNAAGSGALKDPRVQELYPIAPDVLIYWGRMPGDQETVIMRQRDTIRRVNEAILRQSHSIAGKSERLVQDLSRSKYAKGPPKIWDLWWVIPFVKDALDAIERSFSQSGL